MAWTLVQKSAAVTGASSGFTVTPTLPGGSAAHNLLVCYMLNASGTATWTLPAGWVQAADAQNSGVSRISVWYNPDCAASISSVVCTSSVTAGNFKAALAEFHTDVTTPTITVGVTGSGVAGTAATCPVTTGTAVTAGDLVVGAWDEHFTTPAAVTWTDPSGFTVIAADTASAGNHLYGCYQLSAAGGAMTVTGKTNTASDGAHGWTGAVVSFTATGAGGGAGTAGLVGCFQNPNIWGTGTTEAQGIANWQNLTGRPMTVRRVYYASVPGSTTPTNDLKADAAAARRVCFTFNPVYTPADLASGLGSADLATIDAFLNNCKGIGLDATVGLWSEPYTHSQPPYNATGIIADFIGMWKFYSPTIRQYYPAVINFGSYAVKVKNELAVYPGASWVDGLAVDYYCSSWKGDGRPRKYADTSSVQMVEAIANRDSKPLSLYEFNSSRNINPATGAVYDTQADATAFFGYIQTFWAARLALGYTNGDLILFNSGSGQTSMNSPETVASDYRVPLWNSLFDNLNGGAPTTGGGVTLAGEIDLTFTATGQLALAPALSGTLPLVFTASGQVATTGAQPFPAGPLPITVELNLGGNWTDISAYVRQTDPVTIGRGKPDESASVNPSSLTLTLNNKDGRFSARNPNGPYFGLLTRNTGIRVSVLLGATRLYRFTGEVPAWPPQWDLSGKNVWVPVQANGLLRRLQQGTPAPLRSAMYRYWTKLTGTTAPVAYWSCEDGAGATQLAAGLPGITPMAISEGAPQLASFTGFVCSDALPVLNGAQFQGQVPSYVSGGDIVVTFLLSVPAGGDNPLCVPLALATTGAIGYISAQYTPGSGGQLTLNIFDSSGGFLAATAALTGFEGVPVVVRIAVQHPGVLANYSLEMLQPGGTVQSVRGSVTAASSLGLVTSLAVNQLPTNSSDALRNSTIGHVAVQSVYTPLSAVPVAAWAGETAGARMRRLCGEEGLGFVSSGDLTLTVPMGPQQSLKLIDLLSECEAADLGMIYEPRTSLALGYRTRVSIGNQVPDVALSYTGSQIAPGLTPVDDDQHTVNDVTVTRGSGSVTGSSYRAVLNDGSEMSVSQPPAGIGPYAVTPVLNLASDSQVDDLANWLMHMGTDDEARYPVISVNFRSAGFTPALRAQAAAADIGDLITVANTPAWLPPDGIAQVITGITETLTRTGWLVAWNAIPAIPWNVAIVAPDNALTGADSIFPASVGSWTTLFATSNLAWVSAPPVAPPVASGARSAMSAATTGNYAESQWTGIYPCQPGAQYYVTCWFLADSVGQNCDVAVSWMNTAGVQIANAISSPVADSTISWVMASFSPVAPPGAVNFRVYTDCATTTTGQKHYMTGISITQVSGTDRADTDGSTLHANITSAATSMTVDTAAGFPNWTTAGGDFPFDVQLGGERITVTNITGTSNPQTFTITRSVNGVVKAHTAGDDVRLFTTPIAGL